MSSKTPLILTKYKKTGAKKQFTPFFYCALINGLIAGMGFILRGLTAFAGPFSDGFVNHMCSL